MRHIVDFIRRIGVASLIAFGLASHAQAQTDFTSVKPAKEFTITAPGNVNLSAQEWGNPDGQIIIFIHGFLQSHLSWWKQVTDPALTKQFRIITFDITGHGMSDKPWDKAVYNDGTRWADMLKAVLDATGPQKPVVVGWSYGSRIIGDYLNKYGDDRLAAIDFVGSALSGDPKMFGPGIKLLGEALTGKLADNLKATRAFDRACFHVPPSEQDLDQITAISMAVPNQIRQWARRPAVYDEGLKAIRIPVLVTHGMEDQVCLLDLAKHVAATVPNAKTSFYDATGHSTFWERPERFNKELADFVNASVRR